MNRLAQAVAGCVLGLALNAAAAPAPAVPEPSGFWTGPMRGLTTTTLAGGSVIGAKTLAALIARERPLLIDVAAADAKPADLPSDALWRPIHRAVPGSVWMPGAGDAALDPQTERLFTVRIEALAGAKDRPIVAYCHRDCWASWNAAKRLVLKGYKRVYWFPDGVEGWREAYETAVVTEDPAWTSSRRLAVQP